LTFSCSLLAAERGAVCGAPSPCGWSAWTVSWCWYLTHAFHDPLPDLTKDGQLDQLMCDHLELQFRRKHASAPANSNDTHNTERDIESAHATSRDGGIVTLVMDTEG